MKIVLLETQKNIGNKGDVKEVKDGYYRNYLFPKNIALRYSDKNYSFVANKIHTDNEKTEKFQSLVNNFISNTNEINVQLKASTKGKLFASLNESKLKEILNEKINISKYNYKTTIDDEKSVHIKRLGTYNIHIFYYNKKVNTIRLVVSATQ